MVRMHLKWMIGLYQDILYVCPLQAASLDFDYSGVYLAVGSNEIRLVFVYMFGGLSNKCTSLRFLSSIRRVLSSIRRVFQLISCFFSPAFIKQNLGSCLRHLVVTLAPSPVLSLASTPRVWYVEPLRPCIIYVQVLSF